MRLSFYPICFFLLLSITGVSQIFCKKKKVHLNLENSYLEAQVCVSKKRIQPKSDKFYSWFQSGKIQQTQGGFEGQLLHGNFTEYYTNRQLKLKGCYCMGLPAGNWVSWFDNGKMQDMYHMKKGTKTGKYTSWDSSGNMVLHANYVNGKLNGKMSSYENGKLLSEKYFCDGIEIQCPDSALKQSQSRRFNPFHSWKKNRKTS